MHVLQGTIFTALRYKRVAEKLHHSAPIETPPTFFPGVYSLSWCIIFLRWLATRASRHHLSQRCPFIHRSNGMRKIQGISITSTIHTLGKAETCTPLYSTSRHVKYLGSCALCNIFVLGRGGGVVQPFPFDVRNFHEVTPIFDMKTQLNSHAHGIWSSPVNGFSHRSTCRGGGARVGWNPGRPVPNWARASRGKTSVMLVTRRSRWRTFEIP